jgi:hypothetical protein
VFATSIATSTLMLSKSGNDASHREARGKSIATHTGIILRPSLPKAVLGGGNRLLWWKSRFNVVVGKSRLSRAGALFVGPQSPLECLPTWANQHLNQPTVQLSSRLANLIFAVLILSVLKMELATSETGLASRRKCNHCTHLKRLRIPPFFVPLP